jgi:hypothetical protein
MSCAYAFRASEPRNRSKLLESCARSGQKVSKSGEELAEKTNFVTREEVIRGFILASPRVTRGRNRQPLIDHGIDVAKYAGDWDAE